MQIPDDIIQSVLTGFMPLPIFADWLEEHGDSIAAGAMREIAQDKGMMGSFYGSAVVRANIMAYGQAGASIGVAAVSTIFHLTSIVAKQTALLMRADNLTARPLMWNEDRRSYVPEV